jgi:prepilin-type N-terminal cleavage/methylation domain-containing protein
MHANKESGFSLAELLIAMAIMLLISGAATTALLKMTSTQATIWNRTQMHSGIRGATEVLQQEVGQAGRIALPGKSVTLKNAVTAGSNPVTITECPLSGSCTDSTAGMFIGENLVIDAACADTATPCGSVQETVTVTAISSTTITATFLYAHNAAAPVQVVGGFAAGVVPAATTNGSSGTVLKLFGDINADGNMVYVEYSCVIPPGGVGNLYRNMMAWDQAPPSASPTSSQILLSNITANPNGTPCFTYDTQTVNGTVYVTNVAITLTVQTQVIDPTTKQFQTETKALLNVSPRNVFNVWEMATLNPTGYNSRIQPTPASIALLLP